MPAILNNILRSFAWSLSVFLFLTCASNAQSTISLDDFQLKPNDTEEQVDDANSLSDCLSASTACIDNGVSKAVSFSIDDVVNLAVIDRENIAKDTTGSQRGIATSDVSLPSVDLEILFDYNSDVLRVDQSPVLNDLVELVQQRNLSEFAFLLVGHTDAIGSQAFNIELSKRRAASVASYVKSRNNDTAGRIFTSGVGHERLKNRQDPTSSQNRRVQLVLVPVNK